MKKLSILLISLVCLNGCASNQYYFKSGYDRSYKSEFGDINITDSSIENMNNKVKIKFSIENKTPKFLLGGKIWFNLLDEYGLKLNNELLTIEFDKVIKDNDSEWIGSMIDEPKKDRIKNFEIKKIIFNYPAQYKISLIKPKQSNDAIFEDDNIKISFNLSGSGLSFNLNNKTDEAIEINWNKMSYVDLINKSQKIFHNGIKYNDREKEMTETIIPPNASINENIVPISNVSFIDGSRYSSGFWKEYSLLPLTYDDSLKNKTIGLFIPLKINNANKNYNFVFNVNAYK